MAFGFVPASIAADGTEVEIEILGEMRAAKLFTEPLFDPEQARMKT